MTRSLKLLLWAWLACLVAAVAGGVWRGEDLALTLLGVLALLSVALVATPAVLFTSYVVRHGAAAVPREMRRSAVGSGAANLFAGAWIWTLPGRPPLVTAIAVGLAALGAFVIGRVLTLGLADAAAATAPPLRHRAATLTGTRLVTPDRPGSERVQRPAELRRRRSRHAPRGRNAPHPPAHPPPRRDGHCGLPGAPA